MKFARIELASGEETLAVQQDGGALVRARGCPFAGTLEPTGETVEPARWLPPIPPLQIMCIGRNYAEHAAEGGAPPPDYPILFMKNVNAAAGHGDPIVFPRVCTADEVDYEGELVVVIGKPAKDVSKEDALDYVLGYTIGNDVSARVWQAQKGGSQWCRGKGFDTFAPMGPVLVTADAFDPAATRIRTERNGDEVQNSTTDKMIFDVPTLIAFLSQDTTLLPGTVIMSGTPEGIGWVREPKLTLRPGDTVRITIDGIGTLTNEVVAR